MSNGMFKCIDCGEKYNHSMASVNDVALCKWCEEDDTAKWVCSDCGEFYDSCCCNFRDDEYADKGLSRGDFIDKEYT